MRRRHRHKASTRATEAERAAEGVREWQAHSFDSGEQFGHGEEPATSFGSRIWGAVRERFASFIDYFRAPELTPPNDQQPEPKQDQNADIARYFDNQAERDRILDAIRRSDAEQDLRIRQGLREGFAERFGTPPGSDLGPSDEEITKARKIESSTAEPEITDAKAAKLAALARQRAETEQSIRDREKEPDRGYDLEM